MNSLKNKKIVLIGGAGFIGHNLAISLRKKKAQIHVFDHLQVNNLGEFSNTFDKNKNSNDLYLSFLNSRVKLLEKNKIPLHVIDARDYYLMSNRLDKIKPDVVIFLAAVAHAKKANKDPFNTFDHSLRTLENALDCNRSRKCHFIYFSSSMVYGNFENGIVDEKSQCNPLGIYGALKFSGEKLVIAYNQVFGLKYTIIRPSALYGERCVSRRVGQIFIENALKNKSLLIDGDGKDSLDFTYIDDLIHGIEQVIIKKASINKIFNMTYGRGERIIDLAKVIQENFSKLKIIFQPRDKLMPERGTLDISAAKKLLDYKPKFDIVKGMKKYIQWYKTR